MKYSAGGNNWSELDQAALEARACCCLATLIGRKAMACGRPAFGIHFGNKLRQKALKKNLPFAYNKGVSIFSIVFSYVIVIYLYFFIVFLLLYCVNCLNFY